MCACALDVLLSGLMAGEALQVRSSDPAGCTTNDRTSLQLSSVQLTSVSVRMRTLLRLIAGEEDTAGEGRCFK
jgi:hypothetical protein